MALAKDVLTRLPTLFPDQASAPTTGPRAEAVARHLAKYVFPRQFSLHNVFTSPKSQGSYEVLPDYENRELDIKVSALDSLTELGLIFQASVCRDWDQSRLHPGSRAR